MLIMAQLKGLDRAPMSAFKEIHLHLQKVFKEMDGEENVQRRPARDF